MGTRVTTEAKGILALRCRECGRPFALIKGGVLSIQSRHGGREHINTVPLADLAAILTTGSLAGITAISASRSVG